MGACISAEAPEDKEAAKRSKEIDELLSNDARQARKETKLLLLGPGESGKSTIFKQMKLLQLNGGFSKEELESYRTVVFGNCITQMKVLINAANKLGIPIAPDLQASSQHLLDLPNSGEVWNVGTARAIKSLWNDPGIQGAYSRRDRVFQLNDSAKYFFDSIDRYSDPRYVPTTDDVLRARVRSTGIEEAEFKFDNLQFRMTDVGGQRSERRKWIHCFDKVTAVIFCVALSEYDQALREDEHQNRMKESLLLFDEICNSIWFRNVAFVLFLNKEDLFREKIAQVDLNVCFPSYTGGKNYDPAVAFIRDRFVEMNAAPHPLFPHVTCAVSTENVRFVFNSVRETLLRKIITEVF